MKDLIFQIFLKKFLNFSFRTSYDPKIKTFVFFDFETTGFFPEERGGIFKLLKT